MIRLVVRLFLLALLLAVAYAAFNLGELGQAADSPSKSKSSLRDGYGSSLETVRPEPEPEQPSIDVADIEVATSMSRLRPDCPSIEVIEHVKRNDLGSFSACLRAGNDPWIVEAPTEEELRRWPWRAPGASALYIASREGLLEIVRLLVDRYEVSPDWGGALQNVPLVVAIQKGHYDVATFLLDAGADTRRSDPYQRSPLSAALAKRDPKYLRAVLEAGAFPNDLVDETPLAPLQIAINQRRFEHALLLAENGACIPRDLRSLESRLERTHDRDDRELLRDLLEVLRGGYDPDCDWQNTSDSGYRWTADREADEVEIAKADS